MREPSMKYVDVCCRFFAVDEEDLHNNMNIQVHLRIFHSVPLFACRPDLARNR